MAAVRDVSTAATAAATAAAAAATAAAAAVAVAVSVAKPTAVHVIAKPPRHVIGRTLPGVDRPQQPPSRSPLRRRRRLPQRPQRPPCSLWRPCHRRIRLVVLAGTAARTVLLVQQRKHLCRRRRSLPTPKPRAQPRHAPLHLAGSPTNGTRNRTGSIRVARVGGHGRQLPPSAGVGPQPRPPHRAQCPRGQPLPADGADRPQGFRQQLRRGRLAPAVQLPEGRLERVGAASRRRRCRPRTRLLLCGGIVRAEARGRQCGRGSVYKRCG
mmetsp:Transcript_18179/g.68782  ORF Transcript_18179/g.68782 Transcript_18179/m.68782 type:complete len:268 (-) Transcript_18179:265-1068(-)